MNWKKQYTPYVVRYVAIVGVLLISGCASYPSHPPSCGPGEYRPVNPTHMKRGDSAEMREAAPMAGGAQDKRLRKQQSASNPWHTRSKRKTEKTIEPRKPAKRQKARAKASPQPIKGGFDIYYKAENTAEAKQALQTLRKSAVSDFFQSSRNEQVFYLGRYQRKSVAAAQMQAMEAETGLELTLRPFGTAVDAGEQGASSNDG